MAERQVMTGRQHDEFLRCRDSLSGTIGRSLEARPASVQEHLGWERDLHTVVAGVANQWAVAHPPLTTVTIDDVKRVETMACGHIDYQAKFALYVAELVYGGAARG